MPLDAYQPCPCGSGKKIKFCCSKDMIADLDKVVRAVQGEQRVAALEQIERLSKEHGPRAALFALKAEVQMAQHDVEGAAATVAEFQELAPQNPAGLAMGAMLAATFGDVEGAVEQLQRALEFADTVVASTVYSAVGMVAASFLQVGNVIAARGHLLMQAGMAGDQDPEPSQKLVRLNMSRQVPLLLKEDRGFLDCPADVPWRGEFQAAMTAARKGSWLAACESLESLALKVYDEPVILKNVAVLRGWLGQSDLAVAAWRRYAQLEDLPLDEAVESEALAQLIDAPAPSDEYDEVTITYPVQETDRLMEMLLSNPQVVAFPVDPTEFSAEDEPPPKGVFWLLDRPAIDVDEVERESIPLVVGELQLFGKQTQRDARLELSSVKDESFPGTKAILSKVMGDLGGPPSGERKGGVVSAITSVFNWRWHLPSGLSIERKRELVAEQQEIAATQLWPNLKLSILDRKRPVDTIGDETYEVKLLAAILLLDLATESSETPFDFNRLRAQLELPLRESQVASGEEILRITLPRLAMLDIAALSDEDLATAYRRSVFSGQPRATFRFGEEILLRDVPREIIQRDEVYEPLIQWCPDRRRAIELAQQAQADSRATGTSPARWLIMELAIRLSLTEAEECQRIVQVLQAQHLNEPGVGDDLMRLLVSYGIVTPDGRPAAAAGPQPTGQPAPPPEPAGIWTPGGEAEAQPAEAKSKLWVPGME